MGIAKIMSAAPITVAMDDSLAQVQSKFNRFGIHHLLVVENDLLVGVISDRDLLRVLNPSQGTSRETSADIAIMGKKAHQIMSRDVISLTPDAGVYDAIELFNAHTISCIPVVDQHQRPLGIVSWSDIMKVLALKRPLNKP